MMLKFFDFKSLKGWLLAAGFVCLFLLPGLGLSGWGALQLKRELDTRNWPTAPGVIQASRITSYEDSEGTTMYSIEVQYSYRIDGGVYQGTRVHLSEYSTSWRGDFERLLERYPSGAKIQVHYNPQIPSEALLEPGMTVGPWIPLGIGIIFAIVGVGMAIYLLRTALRGEEAPLMG